MSEQPPPPNRVRMAPTPEKEVKKRVATPAGEGLMTVMTHNIRNFSQKNENLVKRLGHLHSCYETADGGLPDVIVIQEVKVSGDRDPVKQLADYFNGPKVKVPGKKFDSMVSQELGTGERAGVIYNSERLKLKKYKHGLPIARNIDANPDLQEANSFGYSSDELNDTSRFPEAVGGGERLFKRLPAYWLFECLETGSELIICSVHLVATDTEHELQRLKDLLSRNPQDLLDQNKLFVLAGDMNFEFSRDPSARTYAVDSTIDSQGQPNWRYLLDVTRGIPSKCTNVARYWNDEGKHLDNIIVPRVIRPKIFDPSSCIPRPKVLQLADLVHPDDLRNAANDFSDHLPVVAYLPMPTPW